MNISRWKFLPDPDIGADYLISCLPYSITCKSYVCNLDECHLQGPWQKMIRTPRETELLNKSMSFNFFQNILKFSTNPTLNFSIQDRYPTGRCPISVHNIPISKNLSSLWSRWVPPSVTIGAATFPCSSYTTAVPPGPGLSPGLSIPPSHSPVSVAWGHGRATQ